ncbi:MAG: hypothetical protein RRZ92_03025 [Bacilli bacterium]
MITKNIKFKLVCSFCLTPMLMSAANPNGIYTYSSLCSSNVFVSELLSNGNSSASCLSNVLNNVAATIDFDYEFYEMPKRTVLFVNYVPVYSLVYRVHVYLNNNVKYKGGVGNWFDGNNPTYLNNIGINADFNGVSNITNATNQYPSNNKLVILNGSATNDDYQTDLNHLETTQYGYQTSCGFISTSYTQTIDELTGILPSTYDQRTAAIVNSSWASNSSKISFQTQYNYGYELYNNGTSYAYKTYNDKYSGPRKDELPFKFSFYGAMNYESDTRPTSTNISVSISTTHGSTTWLDSFSSLASLNINF